MISPKGKAFETLVSGAKTLTIDNKTKSPVTLDADVGTADASKRTTAVKIVGNKLDNVILGGSKSNTLYGESGNDSLWGDAGADVFIYNAGEGDDIIFGFDDKDTLTLDTFDFTATYKNDAVTIKFDEGSVFLKDFTAKTFHVNDETYKISGSKFVKKS